MAAVEQKCITLSIEGNIGAGKSTLLKILQNALGEDRIEILPEPVHKWTNCRGSNLLGTFYEDPKRYAYTFQSFAFITRLMSQQQPQMKEIRILERSSLSDHCFAQNCYETGLMNEVEWAAYQEWWNFFSRSMPGTPDGIIYLRATPRTCHRRVNIRNRNEEEGVSIDYLQQLHDHHEKWLPNKECTPIASSNDEDDLGCLDTQHNLPYIVLNEAEVDFKECPTSQRSMAEKVFSLIERIKRMDYPSHPSYSSSSSDI